MSEEKRLYRPEWFELIHEGIPFSFPYDELPVEELLILDEMSKIYPGLRFNLRKQRGKRYLLTILPTKHIDKDKDEIRGQP